MRSHAGWCPQSDPGCPHTRCDCAAGPTSPTEPRTAREQEPPAPIADAEELVAQLTALAANVKAWHDDQGGCVDRMLITLDDVDDELISQAADTITRLAGEKAYNDAQIASRDLTIQNAVRHRQELTARATKAEAERDALRAERDAAQSLADQLFRKGSQLADQLSAANARADGLQKRIDLLEEATRAGIIQDNPNE